MFNASSKELVTSLHIRGGGDRHCGPSSHRAHLGPMIHVDGITRLHRASVLVPGWPLLDTIHSMPHGQAWRSPDRKCLGGCVGGHQLGTGQRASKSGCSAREAGPACQRRPHRVAGASQGCDGDGSTLCEKWLPLKAPSVPHPTALTGSLSCMGHVSTLRTGTRCCSCHRGSKGTPSGQGPGIQAQVAWARGCSLCTAPHSDTHTH